MSDRNGQKRKVAFLGMPTHDGKMTVGAAHGFYRASDCSRLQLVLKPEPSSLLGLNFNRLWCAALNLVRKGQPVDYFAMIHADIEPEEFWLDKLIAEMEAKELDVLGVVAPIKDVRGVTSIALAREDGDPFRTHARLAMREVFRLPETFTSEDVGHPLLLNTGLWVCKFDVAWCAKLHFTVNDRIAYDPREELYFAQVESEDWFFSRLLHEIGKPGSPTAHLKPLRIGCTRKVKLGHQGVMVFGNTKPWGEQEYDEAHVSETVIPRKPLDWFPHAVPGWLTEAEGEALADLATGKLVLEIGSYCGRSTICLAKTARSVGAVDTFDGRGTATPGDTLATFKYHIAAHNVTRNVNVLKGASADILPGLPPIFDLIFIDGSHDYESVRADAEMSARLLRPGGLLAFHDYDRDEDPGVTKVVDDLIVSGADMVRRVDFLAVIRPAVAEVLEPVGELSNA